MILGVVVGNTSLRWALLETGAVLDRGVVPIRALSDRSGRSWIPGQRVTGAWIGSVNPVRLPEVRAQLAESGVRVAVAGEDFTIPIPNRYRDPRETGTDRLLNALAASRRFPQRGVVVLDFGTALSASVVSPAGEFLGGPIAAGTPALAAALRTRTAQLPEVPVVTPPKSAVCASTAEALEAGIFLQVAGAAERILAALRRELPFPFAVIATGGDARLFERAIWGITLVEPELVFHGLWMCHEHVEGTRRPSPQV